MSNLRGKRIVITRPQRQAGELAFELGILGAVPIYFPVIEISPITDTTNLESALLNLETYDWLVFTSVNGVRAVWDRFAALNITPLYDSFRIAAIGPKTAAALEIRGAQIDFMPEEYVAEAILPGLGALNGKKVLLARADIARPALAEGIKAAGGRVDDIPVYCTLPVQPDPANLNAIRSGVDVVLFTSSSTVRNFVEIINASDLDIHHLPGSPIFACIGPVTAKTVMEYDLSADVIAQSYTTEGLIEAIQSYKYHPSVITNE